MRMDAQEASVSDPVSALGSSTAAALPTANPVVQGSGSSLAQANASTAAQASAATGTVAEAAAPGAQQASPASTLELSAAAGATKSETSPAPITMEEAAQAYQAYLNKLPSNLQFQPDSDAGVTVIKVVNPVTQKVISQIPSDEAIQQAKFLRSSEAQNHSGILLDKSF